MPAPEDGSEPAMERTLIMARGEDQAGTAPCWSAASAAPAEHGNLPLPARVKADFCLRRIGVPEHDERRVGLPEPQQFASARLLAEVEQGLVACKVFLRRSAVHINKFHRGAGLIEKGESRTLKGRSVVIVL